LKALKDDNPWVRHAAALAIDELGPKTRRSHETLAEALKDDNQYVVRVVRHTLGLQ